MESIASIAHCVTLQWDFCFLTTHSATFPVSPRQYADIKHHDWLIKHQMVSMGQASKLWIAICFASAKVDLKTS